MVAEEDSAQILLDLSEHSTSDIIVVDQHGNYAGMVTSDDLKSALIHREAIRCFRCMKSNEATCPPSPRRHAGPRHREVLPQRCRVTPRVRCPRRGPTDRGDHPHRLMQATRPNWIGMNRPMHALRSCSTIPSHPPSSEFVAVYDLGMAPTAPCWCTPSVPGTSPVWGCPSPGEGNAAPNRVTSTGDAFRRLQHELPAGYDLS